VGLGNIVCNLKIPPHKIGGNIKFIHFIL
jgi:hypothetical protein